jgi:two-component system alkaline phosphatase synthesis response regulator PhoP
MAAKILIVEDEQKIARLVRLYLEEAGYSASVIADGSLAVPAFRHERPDLVILDLNLPGTDGLDVCRALRRESNVPVIMLTARSEEADRLVGLELGADDYVTKPFSPREIVARVRAVLRRTQGELLAAETIQAGDLLIDPASRRARIAEHELALTVSEFDILAALAAVRACPVEAAAARSVAGRCPRGYERSIDQHQEPATQIEDGGHGASSRPCTASATGSTRSSRVIAMSAYGQASGGIRGSDLRGAGGGHRGGEFRDRA